MFKLSFFSLDTQLITKGPKFEFGAVFNGKERKIQNDRKPVFCFLTSSIITKLTSRVPLVT